MGIHPPRRDAQRWNICLVRWDQQGGMSSANKGECQSQNRPQKRNQRPLSGLESQGYRQDLVTALAAGQ